MKHIKLDRKDEKIKRFIRFLSKNSTPLILELEGEPVLKVQSVKDNPSTVIS
jgi:hypothetical protein